MGTLQWYLLRTNAHLLNGADASSRMCREQNPYLTKNDVVSAISEQRKPSTKELILLYIHIEALWCIYVAHKKNNIFIHTRLSALVCTALCCKSRAACYRQSNEYWCLHASWNFSSKSLHYMFQLLTKPDHLKKRQLSRQTTKRNKCYGFGNVKINLNINSVWRLRTSIITEKDITKYVIKIKL